tara:strand:+ start:645 stop:1247 length:603 start_codon:yes stop_codon:yes gene_type:complete
MAAAGLLLITVFVSQLANSAYWRGIADDAAIRIEQQQAVIDSIEVVSDSLYFKLQAADSALVETRKTNAAEVARLVARGREAQSRSEAITASLRISLNAQQVIELDAIVDNYKIQIAALDSTIVVERNMTAAEKLRADQAGQLILTMRAQLAAHETKDAVQIRQIEALSNAMTPSLGLRIKADWWMAVAGLGVGYALWGE